MFITISKAFIILITIHSIYGSFCDESKFSNIFSLSDEIYFINKEQNVWIYDELNDKNSDGMPDDPPFLFRNIFPSNLFGATIVWPYVVNRKNGY